MTSTNSHSVRGCDGVVERFVYISLHGEVQTTPSHPVTTLSQSLPVLGPGAQRRAPKDGADDSSSALPLALRAGHRPFPRRPSQRDGEGPDLPVVLPWLPPEGRQGDHGNDRPPRRSGAQRRTPAVYRLVSEKVTNAAGNGQ